MVVVGAGPAGTAAAITAARAGLDVVVVDKATFPRDKICGDGLTTGALRHLEHLGLDPADVESWMTAQDCWIRSPSGRTTRFSLPDGTRPVRRDRHPPRPGLGAGRPGPQGRRRRARRPRHDRGRVSPTDGVEVDVEGVGTVRARWAIGADGMWSPLRKQLGVAAEGYRGEWHAFRQYVSDVGPLASRDLYISFEADIVPGYFWSFPLPDGRANIGFGIQRGGSYSIQDMKQPLAGAAGAAPHPGRARPELDRRRATPGLAHPRHGSTRCRRPPRGPCSSATPSPPAT